MDRFEVNKIIAAIILVVVVVLGINKLANIIYYVKAPEGSAYKVAAVTETKATSKDEAAKTNGGVDINALLTQGNTDHGKKVFNQCTACHSVSKGGSNKIGPALWGVIGREAGSIADYRYSKGMGELNKTWNFESMNAFLIKPKDYVKGTKMGYAGLKKEKDRASVILYLNEQSDSPLPLP
jgi:cytochrome c